MRTPWSLHIVPLVISLVGLLLPLHVAVAQQSPPPDLDRSQRVVQEFARPGEATVLLNVWGSVNRPGLWRVKREADLVELLSVVGVQGVGRNDAGTHSKTIVSVYRNIDGRRRQVYRRNVKDILAEGATYPTLMDRDVLEVETIRRRSIGFQTISTIVGTASSLASLIVLISRN